MHVLKSRSLLGAVSVCVLLGVAASGVWMFRDLDAADSIDPASRSHAQMLSSAFRNAASEMIPSVVTIQTRTKAKTAVRQLPEGENPFEGTPFEDFFHDRDMERFFQTPPTPERRGAGTGVIIDESGMILTNHHVVSGGGEIRVRLQDGREFEAVKVKSDPDTDVAVVWIEGAGSLKAARLGDSSQMEIGDWVLAVGQPFGLAETVTAGIISAKGRGIGVAAREEFLQTDAAINPGNSGGPLINLEGEVIGINTAISSRTGGYQGIGFAIPINLAKWVSRQLIEDGTVQRAYLGTAIQPIDQQLAEQFGVDIEGGALVSQVMKGSPAEKADIRPGDVIVSFAGKRVNGPRQLQAAVETAPIGSQQPVEIIRDGEKRTVQVKVLQRPDNFGLASRRGLTPGGQGERAEADQLGLQVGPLSDEVARALDLEPGSAVAVTAVEPNSPAARAGLSVGTVIDEVNRQKVGSVDEFIKALDAGDPERGTLLRVITPRGTRYLAIKVD